MGKAKTKKLFKVRRSPLHGNGLFAARDLARDTRIVEYTGERVGEAAAQRRSAAHMAAAGEMNGQIYMFELGAGRYIDGSGPDNVARLMNHSCAPNCQAYREDDTVWIYARRDIDKGEELTYDYGFEAETYAEHPCRCGSKKCLGYIVGKKQRAKLKRLLAAADETGKSSRLESSR